MSGGCDEFSSSQIGKAFACTIAAGLATIIGASILWVAPLRNSKFVASALSFSAGVLVFVSLVDIYVGKSVGHFETAIPDDPALAFLLATVCLFGGIPIAYALDWVSHYFTPKILQEEFPLPPVPVSDLADPVQVRRSGEHSCMDCELAAAAKMTDLSEKELEAARASVTVTTTAAGFEDAQQIGSMLVLPDGTRLPKSKLLKMGLLAGLVIAFHNMPEGLVTFLAYLDNIASGITTAVAIAIHNIPEGIIVAIPLYCATGNRLFAMIMASSSALTEPLGALIGLAVACTGSMNDIALGVVFGLVAGIMIYISLKELYPMARLLDKDDKVSTLALVFGMIVMAASLVAIGYTQPPEEEVVEAVVEAVGGVPLSPPLRRLM